MQQELPEPQAAAELYGRSLDRIGLINTVWRKPDSDVVCATTEGPGPHMLNQARDFDADIHLICETQEIRDVGNLPDHIPDEEHGSIFFNVKVHGIVDEPVGYGLPTHAPKKDGAVLKDDIDHELRQIAEAAGLEVDEW